jgi:hypothetical protein
MSGFSDELTDIEEFGQKQERDMIKVKHLRGKIKGMVRKIIITRVLKNLSSIMRIIYYGTLFKAHQGWIDHDMETVKDAKDALKRYEAGGFINRYHKECLEEMRDNAQLSILRNKSKCNFY